MKEYCVVWHEHHKWRLAPTKETKSAFLRRKRYPRPQISLNISPHDDHHQLIDNFCLIKTLFWFVLSSKDTVVQTTVDAKGQCSHANQGTGTAKETFARHLEILERLFRSLLSHFLFFVLIWIIFLERRRRDTIWVKVFFEYDFAFFVEHYQDDAENSQEQNYFQ